MSSFIQAREKGAKKAKKGLKNGLCSKTKTDIYKQQTCYQKSAALRFLPM